MVRSPPTVVAVFALPRFKVLRPKVSTASTDEPKFTAVEPVLFRFTTSLPLPVSNTTGPRTAPAPPVLVTVTVSLPSDVLAKKLPV